MLPDISNHQLPSWQRVSNFNKLQHSLKRTEDANPNSDEYNEKESLNVRCSVRGLENKIAWLQKEHSDMIAYLHYELEKLQSDNQDLQLKLQVMEGGLADVVVDNKQRKVDEKKSSDEIMRLSSLYDETKRLSSALNKERMERQRVQTTLDQAVMELISLRKSKIDEIALNKDDSGLPTSYTFGAIKMTFNPFMISSGNSTPRPPTTEEYEALMKQLLSTIQTRSVDKRPTDNGEEKKQETLKKGKPMKRYSLQTPGAYRPNIEFKEERKSEKRVEQQDLLDAMKIIPSR